MIIKNKKTGKECFVTLDGWRLMEGNPQIKGRYKVVDAKAETDYIASPTKNAIIPSEIVDFKKRIVEKISAEKKIVKTAEKKTVIKKPKK